MEIIQESIFPERHLEYATFGGRFVARVIDGLVMLIPGGIISYMFRTNYPSLIENIPGLVKASLASWVVTWLYFAIMESGPNQGTFGKKAIGIKVTTLNGGQLTFMQASGRYFGKLLSGLIIYIGYFMMLWDDRNQTLHDKMAGAVVVKSY